MDSPVIVIMAILVIVYFYATIFGVIGDKKHSAGMGTGDGYSVVLKSHTWVNIIGLVCCLIASLMMFWAEVVILAIVFMAIGLAIGILPFISTTILDNGGITQKINIRLGSIAILDTSTLIPWSAFSLINYVSNLYNTGFYLLYTKSNNKTPNSSNTYVIIIDHMRDNYTEALKYAVKKVPKDKFTEAAKDELKRMGIWQ
jgi:hypothetical protein